LFFAIGCTDQILTNTIQSYKTNRDYTSLQLIYKKLSNGLSRTEVDSLLGKPDYSPTEGQYYYLSDQKVPPEKNMESDLTVPVGIVIDFRDKNGDETKYIQGLSIGPIGE